MTVLFELKQLGLKNYDHYLFHNVNSTLSGWDWKEIFIHIYIITTNNSLQIKWHRTDYFVIQIHTYKICMYELLFNKLRLRIEVLPTDLPLSKCD